jgi:hypothetical protein
MANEPKLCWGGCGCLLVFHTITGAGRRRVVAFDGATGNAHHCPRPPKAPRVFVEAMQDYSEAVKCDGCGRLVCEVPTRYGVEQFEAANGKWHDCPTPNGVLKGIWKSPSVRLLEEFKKLNLSEPHSLNVIVCVRRISGTDPLYLVALKSVHGNHVCAFFTGKGKLVIGDLSVLGGIHEEQKLFTTSKDLFAWGGHGQPEHLFLPYNWLQQPN